MPEHENAWHISIDNIFKLWLCSDPSQQWPAHLVCFKASWGLFRQQNQYHCMLILLHYVFVIVDSVVRIVFVIIVIAIVDVMSCYVVLLTSGWGSAKFLLYKFA